jgi:hypothetical protein
VCLEPYGVIVNPVDLTIGFDQRLAAVPGGLIALLGARLVFVGDDGSVDPYTDRPEHEPSFFPTFELATVPGTRRAWVIAHDVVRDEGVDVVLLEHVDGLGWQRLASATVEFLRNGVALDDGSLVGWDGGFGLARVRQNASGGVDFAQVYGDALVPGLMSANQFDVFSLPGALVAAVVRTPRPPRSSWLVVTDSDLAVVRPALELSGAGAYQLPPTVVKGQQRTDGTLALVQMGSLAGTGASQNGHNWLLRVEADGTLRDAAPGVLMNPTVFMRGDEALGSVGPPIIFPDGVEGLVWTLFDRIPTEDVAQAIDAAGRPAFAVERELGAVTGLTAGSARDGFDQSYHLDARYRDPERPSADALDYFLVRWNSSFEPVWTRYVQQCDQRTREYGFSLEGAYDDGAWVVWQDHMLDVTGNEVAVPKVARLHSDGTWAWTRE